MKLKTDNVISSNRNDYW